MNAHVEEDAGDIDEELMTWVRPRDWTNPTPDAPYHLLVVGGGPAGIVAARDAALLGARVALVERHRLGGESLNYGAVPAHAFLRTARFYAEMRDAGRFGASPPTMSPVDIEAAVARARRSRVRIARTHSAVRLKALGIDVYFGEARFTRGRTRSQSTG